MSSAQSKLWHLEKINIFKELNSEELALIDQVAQMKSIDKGKFFYFPAEPSKVVFLLKEGRVKIGSYSEEGKEVIKAILEPGEIFGELAAAGQENRTDFAEAMDNNTRCCAIQKDEMVAILNSIPRLNIKFTQLIGLRLQKMERRFESLIFKDAKQRVYDFIRNTALEKGRKVGFDYAFKHKLTHQDMANLTATSRQTVTIVLNELRDKGIIKFDRRSILIHDMEALR